MKPCRLVRPSLVRAVAVGARPASIVAAMMILAAIILTASDAAQAQEAFVRGDVNGDGELGIADTRYLDEWLFHGVEEPACLNAADVNYDGRIDITDSISVLVHVYLGGPPLCEPFPEPAVDPNEGTLPCDATSDNEVVDDPSSRIDVVVSGVSPEGVVDFQVHLSTSVPIAGYGIVFETEEEVFSEWQSIEIDDLSGREGNAGFAGGVASEGLLRIGYLCDLVEHDCTITAGEDRVVAAVRVCLRRGLPPGDYTLEPRFAELVTEAGHAVRPTAEVVVLTVPGDLEETAGCADGENTHGENSCSPPSVDPPDPPDPPAGPVEEFVRGDVNSDGRLSISDALSIRRYLFQGTPVPSCMAAADTNDDGSVNITDQIFVLVSVFLGGPPPPAPYPEAGPDPTPELPCAEYEVIEPDQSTDIVQIGDVEAAPGTLAEIPVWVTNSREIEAFQLLFDFDEELFVPEGLSFTETFYEGLDDGEKPTFIYAGIDAAPPGAFFVGLIPDLIETGSELPPGADQLAFRIRGRVPAGAPVGATVLIEAAAGSSDVGVGPHRLRNELTHRGLARFVTVIPQVVPGRFGIVGDITIFRGDANSDRNFDLSDAIFVLNHLYLGGPALPCPDAADANDDGEVDLTDAVVILNTLFLGASSVAQPYPEFGYDLTEDRLPICDPSRLE